MTINKNKSGFTLVELMISCAIGSVICGTAAWFLVEGTRISLKTAASTTNDLVEWGMVTTITIDSKIANGMCLYPDFNRTKVSNSANRLKDNEAGNVLVLTESTPSPDGKTARYNLLTGYVFDPANKTLKKFVYKKSDVTDYVTDSVEDILERNFNNLVLVPVAEKLTGCFKRDQLSNAAFLLRSSAKRSAVLNVQVSNGHKNVSTQRNKLIEATFFVRG